MRQSRRIGRIASLASALLIGGAASPALAQVNVPENTIEFEDAEFFRPTTDASEFLTVYDSSHLPSGKFSLGLWGDYAKRPLEIQYENSEERFSDLVGHLGTLQLTGALGLNDMLQIGLRIPGYVLNSPNIGEPDFRVSGTEVTVGDVTANLKVNFLERSEESKFGFALIPEVTLPTGNRRAFAGTGEFGYGATIVADYNPIPEIAVGFNIGGLIRDIPGGGRFKKKNDNFNDQLRGGLSVAGKLHERVTAVIESYAAADATDVFELGRKTPVDIVGALRFGTGPVLLTLGGGGGMKKGQGSPLWRAFFGIGPYEAPPVAGAPDLSFSVMSYLVVDMDRNGQVSPGDVVEYKVTAINTGTAPAEELQILGYIPDRTTYVPASITLDTLGKSDPLDEDQGEFLTDPPERVSVRIPILPHTEGENEAVVTFQVTTDPTIASPIAIRNFADLSAANAAPVQLEAEVSVFPSIVETERVVVGGDRIELTETIHFEFDKATILPVSHPILRDLANVLRSYPDLRINIVGHTDGVGTDLYNQRLSDRRARSVRSFLMDLDIAANRLDWEGRGESQPIASNGTPTGRAKNRRTEFLILNREALQNVQIEQRQFEGDLSPESEPDWLTRGGGPQR